MTTIIEFKDHSDLLNNIDKITATIATFIGRNDESMYELAYLIRKAAESGEPLQRILILPEEYRIHIKKTCIVCTL